MSAPLRLRGDGTTVFVTRGGVLEATLTDIISLNVTVQREVMSQGFLGEKTERKDSIFKGIRVELEMQSSTQDIFTFEKALNAIAKRETPNVIINVMSLFTYPNGDQPLILISDVKFGDTPIQTGGRNQYATFRYSGEASDWDPQTS